MEGEKEKAAYDFIMIQFSCNFAIWKFHISSSFPPRAKVKSLEKSNSSFLMKFIPPAAATA
jgi:hypothetical protein